MIYVIAQWVFVSIIHISQSRNILQQCFISQVKSLVQAVAGDMEGAKKTQEQFLRTGLIASQVNSAVVAIQGDHEEARKIQEEFGEETVVILEGTPIIGHAMSAGYAAGGDLAKAEQVEV